MVWMVKKVKGRSSAEAADHFNEYGKRLEEMIIGKVKHLGRTSVGLSRDWENEAERAFAFIMEMNRVRSQVRLAEKRARNGEMLDVSPQTPKVIEHRKSVGVLKFSVSSRFLRECWRDLCSDPQGRERLILVTGPVSPDGWRILSNIERVNFAEQSASFVSAKPDETHRRLIELDMDGHELLGMWHSHIMRGQASTQPSNVDIDMQNRFVKAGCDSIGGIFSLDGYVRIFGTGKPIEVSVYGANVEVVSVKSHEVIAKLN